MMFNKLLTEAEIYVEVDYEDGDIYSDIEFHVARVSYNDVVSLTFTRIEAAKLAKQLNAFVVRADKRMATAKVRSTKMKARDK